MIVDRRDSIFAEKFACEIWSGSDRRMTRVGGLMTKAARSAAHRAVPLGIVSALPEESGSHALVPRRGGRISLAGFHFRPGRIDGHPVVLAEAGVGKVAAALVG